jgi:hypothetical protein
VPWKFLLLFLLVASVSYSAWANTTFIRCMNVTITNATGSALTDFPALVKLPFNAQMQSNYSDLRFYNASCNNGGSLLPYEIENYTGTTADIWLGANLSAANTSASVYFDNITPVSSGQNPAAVWDQNYEM